MRLNASSCCVSAAARWPAFWIFLEIGAVGIVRAAVVQQQLGVAENRGQQVVEVVGDAAGEPADALDLLRLHQPLFEQPAVGDVARDAQVPLVLHARPVAALEQTRAARSSRRRQAMLALRLARRHQLAPHGLDLVGPVEQQIVEAPADERLRR